MTARQLPAVQCPVAGTVECPVTMINKIDTQLTQLNKLTSFWHSQAENTGRQWSTVFKMHPTHWQFLRQFGTLIANMSLVFLLYVRLFYKTWKFKKSVSGPCRPLSTNISGVRRCEHKWFTVSESELKDLSNPQYVVLALYQRWKFVVQCNPPALLEIFGIIHSNYN